MNTRRPPILASFLLEKLRLSHTPLAGDLLEEYQRGRSRLWYLKQVLIAVLADISSRTVQALSILQATVLGWAAQIPVAAVLWHFHIPAPIGGTSHGFLLDFSVAMLAFLTGAVIEFVVCRLMAYRSIAVETFFTSLQEFMYFSIFTRLDFFSVQMVWLAWMVLRITFITQPEPRKLNGRVAVTLLNMGWLPGGGLLGVWLLWKTLKQWSRFKEEMPNTGNT